MPRRFNLLFWLLGVPAVLFVAAGTGRAQDKTQPAPAPAGEEKKESTPWPPPNTVKVPPIKHDESQKKGLELYVPKSWEKTEPKTSFRLAQFTIPAEKGDSEPVELAIFSFGAGAGGGVQPNVQRWVSQFVDNKDRQVKITTGESKQGGAAKEAPYVFVDIKGTYNMPTGPPIMQKTKPLPNARMLAVIIGIRWEEPDPEDAKKMVTKSAIYFLKMAGPEKTVTTNEKAFRASFGAADKENDLESREEPAGSEK